MKFILWISVVCLISARCEAQSSDFIIAKEDRLSLKKYSLKYGIDLKELRRLNQHINGDLVKKGDTLFLKERPKKTVTNVVGEGDDSDVRPVGKSNLFKRVFFQGKTYVVCEIDPRKYRVEIFNKIDKKNNQHSFESLDSVRRDDLILAINGGMFERDLTPLGLYISEGKVYNEVNLDRKGYGNFFELPPNGIFLIDNDNRAFVVATEEYLAKRYRAKLATQSGPMMVIEGMFNPAFNRGSNNLNVRNGVGINKKGNIVLAISEDQVNFYEFAELYRDKLQCENALYLDGFVSQYYAPELSGRARQTYPLGVFLTVSKQPTANPDEKKSDKNKNEADTTKRNRQQ